MARGVATIKAVWATYGRTRSESARNRLMEHYLPLVKQIAQRIHAKLPREVDVDDLVSAGTFGLMDAIAAYDPQRKVKFETYCGNRVRGAILDELRSWDWVPRLARLRAQKLAHATQQLRLELGREPTHDELATRIAVPVAELKKILRDGSLVRVMSLCNQVQNNDNEEATAGDVLDDPRSVEPAFRLDREDIKRLMRYDLSRAEQLIIVLYYFEQMTMKEIGLTLDLSESRVSQMHSSILNRLKQRFLNRAQAA